MTKSLDLGCGLQPKNPFNADEVFGIDVRDDIPANIRSADLAIEPIPFDDNLFDYVSAHDFLEHIPRVLYAPVRRNAFVELMNEIHRVLKTDGMFLSLTPAYPHAPAFRDPTHVNIITDETFPFYFDDVNRWASAYGFKGAFKIEFQEWRGVHLLTVMRKVPLPELKPQLLPEIEQNSESQLNSFISDKLSDKKKNIVELNYALYDNDPGHDLSNPDMVRLHETWLRDDTADHWRHARMMEPVLKCMPYAKADKWLTIGDGHYGLDAIKMKRCGYTDVLPTNIEDSMLKISKERGWIDDYRVENAEALSFADEAFDYVLCKESYHHFPRPMIALYEMLRVAKKGVVLIEPQDLFADHPLTAGEPVAGYEAIGNYIYTISRRELQKVALGLDLPAIAFKSLYDIYFDGVEYVKASEDEPLFVSLVNQVKDAEERCRQLQQKHNVLLAVIFKERPTTEQVQNFLSNTEGWNIISFPGNPYIPR